MLLIYCLLLLPFVCLFCKVVLSVNRLAKRERERERERVRARERERAGCFT